MKKCLVCGAVYPSSQLGCSDCRAVPRMEEGFPAFAPDLGSTEIGFSDEYFSQMAEVEDGHFWFRNRSRLIVWALTKYCSELREYLDIGCGNGYVLSAVSHAYPAARLHGSEIACAGLRSALVRVPAANLMQMDARSIPFVEEFDAIGAFDVLEHIREDDLVLREIHQALKPAGRMFITVPQHAWLWSRVDDYSFHVRRYSANELHEKVRLAGFKILRSTSFVAGLLPLMFASRWNKGRRGTSANSKAELNVFPFVNRIFEAILRCELWLIRGGLNFPIGGSRLLVAAKL
jgi:SAM-dependent methyltransferase